MCWWICREYPPRHNDSGAEIARFVETGKGLVITHSALAEEKPETMGPGCWPVTSTSGQLPPVRFVEVRIVRPDHAVTRGMPNQFKIADALPHGLVVHPGAEVLASVHDETNADGGTSDQPVLLAMQHGRGRVFCTAMGHDLAAMHEPAFIATFPQGN